MKSSSPVQTTSTTVQADKRLYMPTLGSFKACSLIVGFLVGLFIYLSTLGAQFVAVVLWGTDVLGKTNQEMVLFSLAWNAATTSLALVILACLRRLVASVFTAAAAHRSNTEDLASELLSYLEGRFAVGALAGIFVSWNITNMVLGVRPHIIQSCAILAMACMSCIVSLPMLGSPSETLIFDDSEGEEEQTVAMYTVEKDTKLEPLITMV